MTTLALPLALAVCLLLALTVGVLVAQAEPPAPLRTLNSGHHLLPPYANPLHRFGFGRLTSDPPTDFEVGQLNAGWYTDWSADRNPPHPDRLAYAQLVNLMVGSDPHHPAPVKVSPGIATIVQIAAAHPRSLWMLGNHTNSEYRGLLFTPRSTPASITSNRTSTSWRRLANAGRTDTVCPKIGKA